MKAESHASHRLRLGRISAVLRGDSCRSYLRSSSFYGLGARQSSVLGEDPLFSDHDPVALLGIARQGTMGHTLSSSRLAKTLTTITERAFPLCSSSLAQVPVGIPFIKRLTSPAAIGALIGTLLAIIVMFIPLDPENKLIQRCAGVLIIMGTLSPPLHDGSHILD